MTLAHRMYALIAAAFVGLAMLAALGMIQVTRVYDAATFTTTNVVPSLLALDDANVSYARMRVVLWKYVATKDAAQKPAIATEMNNYRDKTLAALDKYEKMLADDKDRSLLATDRTAIADYETLRAKLIAMTDAGQADEAIDMLAVAPQSAKVSAAFKAHNEYNIELAAQGQNTADTVLGRSRWMSSVIGLAIIAMVAGLGLAITRKMVGSMKEAVDIAQTVANGDLTRHIDVHSNDEVGQLMEALKNMNASLVKIVGQVRNGTDTISTASAEIASGNMDLSARTESQASSLEETAASMEELTSTVKQNADNARQANQLAQAASEVATKGGDVVAQVVDTMGSINESSKKIVDIITVIDSIAFQTNILALNAAVEAARAGEQGRGFAVVAAEVRNLAQRSAAAAKEIKELIDNSVQKVDTGSKLVDQAGMTMSEVVDSIRRVTDIMSEITAASGEQSQGIAQVNEAIMQMESSTQQNAALVEEAAAAAKSLQDQAVVLAEAVGVFKLDATQRSTPALRAIPTTPTVARPAAHPTARSMPAQARANIAIRNPSPIPREKAEGWDEF